MQFSSFVLHEKGILSPKMSPLLFSSPWAQSAHGELLWSVNVRRPSCVVRRQQFALQANSSWTLGPMWFKLHRNVA